MHPGVLTVLDAVLLLLLAVAGAAVVFAVARARGRRRLPGPPPELPPPPPGELPPAPAAETEAPPVEPLPERAATGTEEAVEPRLPTEPEPHALLPPVVPPTLDAEPLPHPPPPRAPRLTALARPTRHPVVLAHGFGGFDRIGLRGRGLAYFRGVPERLQAAGVEVHVLRMSPLGSIPARARQLAEQVDRLGADRVNIVAHSMGGLDARYAIAALGIGPRVASLTTIGTPHHGTPLADLGASLLLPPFGRRPADRGALLDLTTARMEAFEREIVDVAGVEYGCVVVAARRRQVHPLLLPAYLFLRQRAGDNDGVVPVASQRRGEVRGEIEADHWGAVGWSGGFDAAAFYERLTRDLGARGL